MFSTACYFNIDSKLFIYLFIKSLMLTNYFDKKTVKDNDIVNIITIRNIFNFNKIYNIHVMQSWIFYFYFELLFQHSVSHYPSEIILIFW